LDLTIFWDTTKVGWSWALLLLACKYQAKPQVIQLVRQQYSEYLVLDNDNDKTYKDALFQVIDKALKVGKCLSIVKILLFLDLTIVEYIYHESNLMHCACNYQVTFEVI